MSMTAIPRASLFAQIVPRRPSSLRFFSVAVSTTSTLTSTTSTLTSSTSTSSTSTAVSKHQRRSVQIQVDHRKGAWKTYGDLENYQPGKYQIKCYNKISDVGLSRFSMSAKYDVRKQDDPAANAHAILLRSHKLQESDVPLTVRAIARCGAGTNNIPVARMTELGIPVFNTPGANANAVKELILCGLLLGSRGVIAGINHMKQLGKQGVARERVEKEKALFGGREIKHKTLAVIGLGHIGAATARDAHALGMNLRGYDPGLTVKSALLLPPSMQLTDSIASAVADADYISLNIPYVKGDGGTHGIIGRDIIEFFKQDAVLLNFARGELVDSNALKPFLDNHAGARYISDFPDDVLWNHPNALILPHLGASTEEAEDSAASMAVDTVRDFLETGTIRNSVNFPDCFLGEPQQETKDGPASVRLCVVNSNVPGVLAKLTDSIASEGFNISQQINVSRGNVAYNVLDIDTHKKRGDVVSFQSLQEKITMLEGVLSSRVIYGKLEPGQGYAKNVEGEYFV